MPAPEAPYVVFAGGGTGGHLTPSLAILEALRSGGPVDAGFLCSTRPIDARVLGAAEERFAPVPAAPFSPRPRALARFIASWGKSVRAARPTLRGVGMGGRRAGVVVATGGFVAAPVAQAARAERVPVIAVNLDAAIGKANRWLARRAVHRFVVGASARGWTTIRPIVRPGFRLDLDPGEARRSLGLDPDRPTLLVTGGSLGARTLNEAVTRIASSHADALRGWQVLHQCGEGAEEALRAAYGRAGIAAEVRAFVERMDQAWSAADAAVARAGASTVAEAWASATPTVFLPYPFHRDHHQRLNAAPLADAGGGAIVEDRRQADATAPALRDALRPILDEPQRRESMRRSIIALGPADGADTVARSAREVWRGSIG
jgi:UDP-N-acetylglucosamine--N-acetylmuramyl-(pentapeptide) pyrophosphoryl-undecaprenol N-acetylglucosamine transferase